MNPMFHRAIAVMHICGFSVGEAPVWLHQLARTLQQDFLPSHCLICHISSESSHLLCNSCFNSIRRNPWACQQCGHPGSALINHCRRETALHFVQAGLEYSGVTRELIHRWKFNSAIELTHLLVQLALEAAPIKMHYHALVPVPMHWRGRWRRGYNQSKLLAQVLSKTLGQQSHWKPRVVDNLIASHRKKAQHHMDRQQRQINTLGRYTTNRSFSHQSVLIIDDVVTTGNTLEAVAATLAKAGATRIDAWCLARAPQTHEVTAPSI